MRSGDSRRPSDTDRNRRSESEWHVVTRLAVVLLTGAFLVGLTLGSLGGVAGSAAVDERASGSDQFQAEGSLVFSPSNVDFGSVQVGQSENQTVTVRNESPNPVVIGNVTIEGNTSAYEIVSPAGLQASSSFDNVTVPPGLEQSVTIQFRPDAARSYDTTIQLSSPDGDRIAELSATGEGIAPDVSVDPDSITFANATVDRTTTKQVTVSNQGEATLSISGTSIEGADVYAIQDRPESRVEPGGSTTVTVAFEPETTDQRTATLSIRSDDPDQPEVLVGLSNTDTELRISGRTEGERQRVDVSVQNAKAGEEIEVPMPETGDEDEQAAMESVSVETSVSDDLDLEIDKSERPTVLENEFQTDDNAVGLLHLDVEKSVDNEAIESVTYQYRVRKDSLESSDTDPEDIAMYRYEDGEWIEKPTKVVGETDTHYRVRTNADGFSEWTAAAKQPQIEVADTRTNVTATTVGETVAINVRLTNEGGADGVYETKLYLNGSVVDQREVTVPSGGTVQVDFQRPFEDPGTYEVAVNDVFVGTINVTEEQAVEVGEPTPSGGSGGDTTGDESGDVATNTGGGPLTSLPVLFGIGAVLLVTLAGGLLYARDRSDGGYEPSIQTEQDPVVEMEGFDENRQGTETRPDRETQAGRRTDTDGYDRSGETEDYERDGRR